jgi:glyoxylase-like metal-dependent hydrolase (beta-lactamase superfamily II)
MWCFIARDRPRFVGDVLFAGSIGRTDFPQGNHEQLIASITQRLWPMGDDTVFIPWAGEHLRATGAPLRVYLEPASLRMLTLGFSAGLPLLLVLGTLSLSPARGGH